MRPITGTHVKYFHVCHRKLWLYDREVIMEHTSEAVAGGELLHATSYLERSGKYREITLDGSKIDFYDPKAHVIHEVKSSAKLEHSHVAQLKFYLWLLKENGLGAATGILEYPKQRQTETITLTEADEADIRAWISGISTIQQEATPCPPVINKPFCKQCSYYEFCYVGDEK